MQPASQVFTVEEPAKPTVANSEATWNVAEQHENQQDDENGPERAARPIPPLSAIAPSWKAANKQENDDDEKDDAHGVSPVVAIGRTAAA